MRDLIAVQQKIAPELIELMEKRYTILQHVSRFQPVGRRSLAQSLKMGERIVRAELDFLKNQGLLAGDVSGVKLTGEGEEVIHQLADLIKQLRGLHDLETRLKERFRLGQVIIVPGDSDQDELVKKEMGRVAARYLLEVLRGGSTIAVTGGTTVNQVAEAIPVSAEAHNVLVVPARGGLGEDVEIQANTIAAKIAKKLMATYRLLYVPDNIGEEAIKTLSKDPHLSELAKTIRAANVLLHGIGNAGELSLSRGDSREETRRLIKSGAVGEAFGHYFARDGTIVRLIHSLGLQLGDLKNIDYVIGVAGGRKKAAAISAVLSSGHGNVLVTDEAAAREILSL